MSPTATVKAGLGERPLSKELIFELTPAEFWAWNYLIYLARAQGNYHIILPRPGEDVQAEKVFSRKHQKRLLKALKAKLGFSYLLFPRSKTKHIEVVLPASRIGDLGVPNRERVHRCPQ